MKERKKSEDTEVKVEVKKETFSLVTTLLFVPGCLLVGIAIGILINELLISSLLGLGLGFIFAAVFKSVVK